jgi:hypothetical protein
MTRIRKLFLGIFLMVFTLGIGVFIFVQVGSKDAGTGKSRPLSMAEKILKYDDDLNAYIEENYDEEDIEDMEHFKNKLYRLKERYPYFSYASLDEFYGNIMAEYEGDDDAILIIYGTSNWNTSASYEDEELNRCVERAAAEASWQEQQRDPEQKKLRKELYYLKKHHPDKSYEELYANIENVHHDVITTEEWYVINHVDMSDELMEYVDSLLPEADEEELKTDPNLDDLRKFLYIENANRPYCTYEELTRITYHEGLRFRNARELTPQEDESFQKAMKEQGISFVY